MSDRRVPPGYERASVRGAEVVALASQMPAVREALLAGTLHDYAERHPEAAPLRGRDTAYAVPLPGRSERVVIRHSRHGGTLAPLTRDLFLFPRAARELEVALRLAGTGVPTPEIVAYALYPTGVFRRSDVASREVTRSRDLASALADGLEQGPRRLMLEATARLVARLGRAGARHPDLNLKNILLAPGPTSRVQAWVLDVDRVVFESPGSARVTDANLARIERSARKWRDEHGAPITEEDLSWLTDAVMRELRSG